MIAGYLGSGQTSTTRWGEFAVDYSAQNRTDFRRSYGPSEGRVEATVAE